MPTTVSINFNAQQILDSRGLGADKKAQRFFTNEIYKISQPYTPFDSGTLTGTVQIEDDSITYKVPYARAQWFGMSKNDKPFNYEGEPMRGRQWTNRAFIDRGEEVLQGVVKITGGKVE
jgi:hypothetical protein